MPKMALYEKWEDTRLDKYGYSKPAKPTICIAVFTADENGLELAVEAATRPDAVLVKLDQEYYKAELLKAFVEEKIEHGKFVSLFRPSQKVPRR